MELKDVILSTLAEMEDDPSDNTSDFSVKETVSVTEKKDTQSGSVTNEVKVQTLISELETTNPDNELMFLNSIRERLLVLFEGFQAPNNTNIEAKVDMTLNFLEYVLATIDNRVQTLNKGHRE